MAIQNVYEFPKAGNRGRNLEITGGLRPGARLLRPGANLHSRFCLCPILPAPWRESAAPRREALQNQFKTEFSTLQLPIFQAINIMNFLIIIKEKSFGN